MNTHPQPFEPTSSPWTELYQEQAEAQASQRPMHSMQSKAAPQARHAEESEAAQPTYEALHSIYNHE